MRPSAWFVLLVLVAALAGAQSGPTPPPANLAVFLDLTATQAASLTRLNADFEARLINRWRRVAQVQYELREHTAAAVLDPAALGVRYAELELICREARAEEREVSAAAVRLLNPGQRQRLQFLEQAYSLYPIILQAQSARLMDRELPAGAELPVRGLPANVEIGLAPSSPARLPGCQPQGQIVTGVITNPEPAPPR